MEYPFTAEYAKSGRAGCKSCKDKIDKDELRVGIMIQSAHFDGRIPMWYHYDCFWQQSKSRMLKSPEEEIHHFENLRWGDQERIRQFLGGKEEGAGQSKPPVSAKTSDFQIEYSKNNAAKCRECSSKILKGEMRISRQEEGKKQVLWYHLTCFAGKRSDFGFNFNPDEIAGYESLTDTDKGLVQEKLKSLKRPAESNGSANGDGKSAAKKTKLERESSTAETEKSLLMTQNHDLWKLRDSLSHLKKKVLSELLTHNGQDIPAGDAKILDRLTDCMLFGALEKCTECSCGQLVYSTTNNSYVCTGNISGFTRCQYSTTDPRRRPFIIPADEYEDEFLSSFVFVPGRKRVFNTAVAAGKARLSVDDTKTSKLPLSNMKFLVVSDVSNETRELIRELGGAIVKKIDAAAVAVITPKMDISGGKNDPVEIRNAMKANLHVIDEMFVSELNRNKGSVSVAALMEKHILSSWGGDIKTRLATVIELGSATKAKSISNYSSGSTSQKMVIKGGVAVDPACEVAEVTHVYQDAKKNIFNAILGKADVQAGTNSYYKLQLLEHDKSKCYYVYRAWGRTGTTIGGTKLDEYDDDLEMAQDEFYRVYLEKTGNSWKKRNDFHKRPGLFYPLDIDYGEETKSTQLIGAGSTSLLSTPVQELIKLIFDVDQMKNTLQEFEIDLTKMPLGKLSKKQIQSAYKLLTLLQETISLNIPQKQTKVLDYTNQFFTLIPHDFGLNKPPLLDTLDAVTAKTQMLDNLLEIEIAYSLLKSGDSGDEDPLDVHYRQLKAQILVLDKSSAEFIRIVEYVSNTHAATHNTYSLSVEEVFVVKREGEAERFKPFSNLHNRQLLWHGSRVTNFAGILSQGLRIAPPEAPVTGYMFGKGIYFADMVSKSANYCFTSKANPTGLVLLSEVALGTPKEFTAANMVTKLPADYHSVKGVGKTVPDPKRAITADNGVIIPLGKGIPASVKNTSLLYNEYIVYDVNQVNIKYLVKLKFNYKF